MFRRKPSPASSNNKVLPTYLAPSSELQGTLHVEGNLLVEGIIHGTVEVRGDMEISANGLVEGPELRARNLIVHGVLKARVVLEGQLTLKSSARLEGDVVASALSIETGAYYVGYIETSEARTALPGVRGRPELAGGSDDNY